MKILPKISLISAAIIVCLITASSIGALSGTNSTPKTPVKDGTSAGTTKTDAAGSSAEYIGDAAAKDIVLLKVPGATINKLHFEFDDGIAEYDGEAYLDTTKYEFEINAVTGVVTEWKTDIKTTAPNTSTTYIGVEAAKAIALAKVPGATISEIYLENDDGKVEYDGEMYLNNTQYEFSIDAVSGVISDWEAEVDDDHDEIDDEDDDDDEIDDEDDDDDDLNDTDED